MLRRLRHFLHQWHLSGLTLKRPYKNMAGLWQDVELKIQCEYCTSELVYLEGGKSLLFHIPLQAPNGYLRVLDQMVVDDQSVGVIK
jgi:hypothetical protein